LAVLEISRLIAEVKERHGIRIEASDAAFALVTLNQLVLEDLARHLEEGVRSGISEFNEVVQKTETRAGRTLAQYVKGAGAEIRGELQKDVENARLKATEIIHGVHGAPNAALARCGAAGIIAGLVLFGLGMWTGAQFFR
jgi:hypothetical protein